MNSFPPAPGRLAKQNLLSFFLPISRHPGPLSGFPPGPKTCRMPLNCMPYGTLSPGTSASTELPCAKSTRAASSVQARQMCGRVQPTRRKKSRNEVPRHVCYLLACNKVQQSTFQKCENHDVSGCVRFKDAKEKSQGGEQPKTHHPTPAFNPRPTFQLRTSRTWCSARGHSTLPSRRQAQPSRLGASSPAPCTAWPTTLARSICEETRGNATHGGKREAPRLQKVSSASAPYEEGGEEHDRTALL